MKRAKLWAELAVVAAAAVGLSRIERHRPPPVMLDPAPIHRPGYPPGGVRFVRSELHRLATGTAKAAAYLEGDDLAWFLRVMLEQHKVHLQRKAAGSWPP